MTDLAILSPTAPIFTELLTFSEKKRLLTYLSQASQLKLEAAIGYTSTQDTAICLIDEDFKSNLASRWQALQQLKLSHSSVSKSSLNQCYAGHPSRNQLLPTIACNLAESVSDYEYALTDWFIDLFNGLFAPYAVQLVRGQNEPEYLPATADKPAQVIFAHGFFSSSLHEVSHWCIAGKRRRQLVDYGYWYAPDGRSEQQQHAFESLEIKPQAIECLFSLSCHQPFRVSQDNLFANFDTSQSTFAQDVYQQVKHYLKAPDSLPKDAKRLLRLLLQVTTVEHLSLSHH